MSPAEDAGDPGRAQARAEPGAAGLGDAGPTNLDVADRDAAAPATAQQDGARAGDGEPLREEGQEDELEGAAQEPQWARDRGHERVRVAGSVKGKNVFLDSTIYCREFNAGGDRDVGLPVADVTGAVAAQAARFVEPASFGRLMECARDERVVLLGGVGCGARTAARVALLRTGHRPILELPSGVPARALVDEIEHLCKSDPDVGVVIESLDSETAGALAGFELRRLRGALAEQACVMLAAGALSPTLASEVPLVECVAPDMRALIERAGADEASTARALAALELLDGRTISPQAALALLDAAAEPGTSPAQLAEACGGAATEKALNEWLQSGRSAEQLAALAAGAALETAALSQVDERAAALANMLEGAGAKEEREEPRTFKLAQRGWPADVLKVVRRPLQTSFGSHEAEVVEVCSPHTRERVLAHLWVNMGRDFREPLLQWLRRLPASADGAVGFGAAVTAGALFACDPVVIESELLSPWAASESPRFRACAGVALGVPVAIGADPTAARALARAWGRADALRLRHTAVLAYGGVLGAWDPAVAAPSHLWRIGAQTPALRRPADVSLAALMASGDEAGRVRATVVELLYAQASRAHPAERAFGLLAPIVEHLTAREPVARESLRAFMDERERHAWRTFAELFALALLSARGYERGCVAVRALLGAVAEGRVDEQTASVLIETVLAVGAQSRAQANGLRSRLRRPLEAHARAGGPVGEAAEAMLASGWR
jgi:hypothetical protein